MKKVYIVTTNCGDGSNYLEWHKTMSEEKADKLLESDLERYGSGDGFQCQELSFPNNFDLELFAYQNRIYWYEDGFGQELEDELGRIKPRWCNGSHAGLRSQC